MACSGILSADSDENRRPLACRRSVSWYGVRLCILKESIQAASQAGQLGVVFDRLPLVWCPPWGARPPSTLTQPFLLQLLVMSTIAPFVSLCVWCLFCCP
ncbi:hypothetical protein QQF64_028626 [Cirrhinus molitorella]|uniref:Uncharacterized protein n=1 Tax=Cirrhinus molitorella TaxID=172907 RepID=A0ABR3N752_9TELE